MEELETEEAVFRIVWGMGVARTIAKNTIFNLISAATDFVVNFVVGIVLARGLGTEQYGIYALLMWFLSLAALVVNLGAGEMSKRFIAEALGAGHTQEPQGLVRLTLMLRGGAGLAGSLVILALSRFWAELFGNAGNHVYFAFIAFTLLPQGLNYALITIFTGFQKYEYAAYVTLGTGPLRLALIIIFMVVGFGIQQVLIVHIATLTLGILIGLILLRRLMPLNGLFLSSLLDRATKKRALKYALIMAGYLGLDYLAFREAAVFFIGLYCPAETVGFYTLAVRLGSMSVTLLPATFSFVLLPAFAEQFGKGDMGKIKTIYLTSARYLMVLSLPLAAAMIALASPIVTLLYGTDYAPTVTLMRIIIIPLAIGAIGQAAEAMIFGINRPGFVLKMTVVLALLNVGLNLWLVPRYGVLGAAIASSVPRVLYPLVLIKFASVRAGTHWPMRDTIKITLASCIMGLVLFGLQVRLGVALSLALGIVLGMVIYSATLFVLRVIQKQDMVMLKGIQDSLPGGLKKHYVSLVGLAERIMVGREKVVRH